MLDKIKSYKDSEHIKSLSDIRTLGLIAFGVVAILVTWSSIKVVQTNYELQKQISTLSQKNEVQALVNNNLKLKNQYYDTDTYLELAARRYYNKGLPGEKLLIVPKAIALENSIELPEDESKAAEAEVEAGSSAAERNFNAWLDFLFHRQ